MMFKVLLEHAAAAKYAAAAAAKYAAAAAAKYAAAAVKILMVKPTRLPLPLPLLLLFSFLTVTGAHAQNVNFKAATDTSAILIGEQFRLELSATLPSGLKVIWPSLPDTFSGFEVVNRAELDTTLQESGSQQLFQKIVLTAFDSGFHVIPPFSIQYVRDGDTTVLTAETEPLLITVGSIPVDTTKAIKDIKDLVRYPFTFQDALPWIFGILIAAMAGWLVYYLLKRNRKKVVVTAPAAPVVPPHERALAALQQIEEEKIWQQGNVKLYFTRVTDVIRKFISETQGIDAMEMTSSEILSLNIIKSLSDTKVASLKQLLESSDLVKFAKATPLPSENEQAMRLAVQIVSESNSMQTISHTVSS
jgi:hypothetical protein